MGVHICSFSDPCDYKIKADGKEYLFDFSETFGPSVQRPNGRGEVKNQPLPKVEFWKAVTLWAKQGRRIGEDGLCIWEYPPKQIAYRLTSRTLLSEALYKKLRNEGKITIDLEQVEVDPYP